MLKNYTISYSEKDNHLDYDLVQFTLNRYQTAAARSTFIKLAEWNSEQKVVVHMDYIKTFTRFPIMRPSIQNDFIAEIASILIASNKDLLIKQNSKYLKPDVLGVVIHSDSPIAQKGMKDLFENGIPKTREEVISFCEKYWSSPFFDTPSNIYEELEHVFLLSQDLRSFIDNLYNHSFLMMMQTLRAHIKYHYGEVTIKGKVFIENTTKTPLRDGFNLSARLQELAKKDSIAALCFDEEHAYACGEPTLINYETGELNLTELDKFTSKDLIHVNTIPENVAFGSFVDRHAETTIFESKAPIDTYLSLTKELEKRGINYVREIRVVEREIEQLKELETSKL